MISFLLKAFRSFNLLIQFANIDIQVTAELQAKTDLVIGNYSEGNLVAHKLGVTQCTIAHALEKTKYPDSDIYWKNFDEKYHFSSQFTADLNAMNHTDFIITNTFQEIAGRYTHSLINSLKLFLEKLISTITFFPGPLAWRTCSLT
ncbi:hypothetical protein L1987_40084 [Smallanthus sonchifolius]|uniref:Uncharacterized protein n=1 Tax=Smallanthus sonchifolius TaxID=185202 RepID=A0ACB9GSE2_9ASTR|nr:hypothetical protein L1987_40084 [Smallanthus sonchifolius]